MKHRSNARVESQESDCHPEPPLLRLKNLGEPRDGPRFLRANNRAFGSLP
jgi:hypothetical protein